MAVTQPQTRGRNEEHRIAACNAQIATDGDIDTATDAKAAYTRQRRFAELIDSQLRRFGDDFIAGNGLARRTHVLELRNIRARHKCFFTSPREHHHAHPVIAFRLSEQGRNGLPHVDRQGIMARRMVETDVQRRCVEPHCYAFGRRLISIVIHQYTPFDFIRARSSASRPSSLKTSSVCSPRRGAARTMRLGVRSSCMGCPIRRCGPRCLDSTF